MLNYSFDQSEADTILFSANVVLRESGYNGPIVIDAADTDVYVNVAALSHKLPGTLCIKRKDDTFDCHRLVTATMAERIVQPHYMTGCDFNSSFYAKGKKSVFDQVAKVLWLNGSSCGVEMTST